MFSALETYGDTLRTVADVHLYAEEALGNAKKADRFMERGQNEILAADKLQDITVSDAGSKVTASCQGSSPGNSYNISITVSEVPGSFHCTCQSNAVDPMCKHILGLLCWRVRQLAELRQAGKALAAPRQNQGGSADAGASGTGSTAMANGRTSATPCLSQAAVPAGRRMKPTFLLKRKEQKPNEGAAKQTELPAAMQLKPPVARSPAAAGAAVKQERKQTQLTLQQAVASGAARKQAAARTPDLKRGRSEGLSADEERPMYRPCWCDEPHMLELADDELMQLGRDAILAGEGATNVAPAESPAAGPLPAAAAAAAVAAVQQPPKPAQRQVWATMPTFGKPKAKSQMPAKAAPYGVAQEAAAPAGSRKSSLAAAIRSYAGGANGAASPAEPSAGWRSSKAARGTQEVASPSAHDNTESGSQRSAAALEQPAEAGAAEAAAAAPAEDEGKGLAPPVSITSVEEDTKALYAALFGMPLDVDDEAAASAEPSDAGALRAGPVDAAPPDTATLLGGASGASASLMDAAVGSIPCELPSSSQATADTSVPVTAMHVAKFAASAQATTQTQDATEPLQQEQHAAEPLLHVQLATQVEACSVEQQPAGVLATQKSDQQPAGVRARAKRSLQQTFRKQ